MNNTELAVSLEPTVFSKKQSLRHMLKARRNSIAPAVAARAAQRAAARLLAETTFSSARTVAVYCATRSEIDAWPLIAGLQARGAAVLLPRVDQQSRTLSFHPLGDRDALRPSPLGIYEPVAELSAVPLSEIELFVIPGLGFDGSGTRLGWGLGYYDRTLSENRGTRVGFAYDCQLLPQIPRQPGDVAMHFLVTEQRTLCCVPL